MNKRRDLKNAIKLYYPFNSIFPGRIKESFALMKSGSRPISLRKLFRYQMILDEKFMVVTKRSEIIK